MSGHSDHTKRLPEVSSVESRGRTSALRPKAFVQKSTRLNTGATRECPSRAAFARLTPRRLDRQRRTVPIVHDLGASQFHSFRTTELGEQKISPNERDNRQYDHGQSAA
jgi:hypothetical protein